MTHRILKTTLAALTLSATASMADIQTVIIEDPYGTQAMHSCNLLAEQEGAAGRGSIRNVSYGLYECSYDVPPQRNITIEVMPLLHVAQARPVCRSSADQRGGRWTGDWQGNGAFAPGTCTIRVPA